MDPITGTLLIAKAGATIGGAIASFASGEKLEKAFQRAKQAEAAANMATAAAEGASVKLDIYRQESQNIIKLNAQATKKGVVGFGSETEEAVEQVDITTRARKIQSKINLANALAGSEQRRGQGRLNLAGSVIGAGLDAAAGFHKAGAFETSPPPLIESPGPGRASQM